MLSFSEVAALWKNDKRRYIKTSSYAVYLIHLNRHLIPFFGEGGLPSDKEVQSFVDSQLEKGLSEKTVRESMLLFKMIIRYGEEEGIWPHAVYKVRFPAHFGKQREVVALTKKQQRTLSHYLLENFSFRNIGILICLHTGLRIGEVCALQWRDIDLENNEFHISKTVQRVFLSDGPDKEYYISLGPPKTPSSHRDIPLSDELIKILEPLKGIVNEDYFVVSNAPDPLEPRYYRDYFKKLMKNLGLPPVRFHCLRHTFATRCIEGKCDYKTVSAILGHASLATTMDIYVHPGHDDKKRCIDQMAGLIGG